MTLKLVNDDVLCLMIERCSADLATIPSMQRGITDPPIVGQVKPGMTSRWDVLLATFQMFCRFHLVFRFFSWHIYYAHVPQRRHCGLDPQSRIAMNLGLLSAETSGFLVPIGDKKAICSQDSSVTK